jgi:hypothetical protein
MLKSIGRSSHFWAKTLAALSPRSLFTARLFIARVSAAVAAGVVSAGVAMRHAH